MSHRLLPALPVASAARSVAHELFPLQHCSSTCRTREVMLQLLILDNIGLKHSGSNSPASSPVHALLLSAHGGKNRRAWLQVIKRASLSLMQFVWPLLHTGHRSQS